MGGIISGVVGGILGKKSAKKQARRVEEAATAAAGTFDPFSEAGLEAAGIQGGAIGVGGSEASDAAFQNFLGSTGFKSQLAAGSEAITGNQAAKGLLNSGSTLKRLNTFGQDLAKQGFSNFLGNVDRVASRGFSSVGKQADIATGGANAGAEIRAGGSAALQSGLGQATSSLFSMIPGMG